MNKSNKKTILQDTKIAKSTHPLQDKFWQTTNEEYSNFGHSQKISFFF